MQHFTDKQLSEIAFCLNYTELFNHGTDGHDTKALIAKMAQLLTDAEERQRAPVGATRRSNREKTISSRNVPS
jgi:hypothetical protein